MVSSGRLAIESGVLLLYNVFLVVCVDGLASYLFTFRFRSDGAGDVVAVIESELEVKSVPKVSFSSFDSLLLTVCIYETAISRPKLPSKLIVLNCACALTGTASSRDMARIVSCISFRGLK